MMNPAKILIRPSTWVRAFWLGVVALHLYLFARRILDGEWGGTFNQAQLALGIIASGYGLIRVWRVAAFLDRSPRKTLAIALILILGHLAKSPAAYKQTASDMLGHLRFDEILLVVPTVLGMALVFAGAALVSRIRRQLPPAKIASPSRRAPRGASPKLYLFPILHQRPPPLLRTWIS